MVGRHFTGEKASGTRLATVVGMIKLAAFTFIAVLVATFYTGQARQVSKTVKEPMAVEEADRQFLAALGRQASSVGSVEREDREFLANLQVADRLSTGAGRQEMPVMRAIPMERAMPIARGAAPVAADETLGEVPEVRRAVPVGAAPSSVPSSSANLRNALRESFVTMVEPEVRQTAVNGKRASITIHGDEVVIRPRMLPPQGQSDLR
jgi:hypothetical protein